MDFGTYASGYSHGVSHSSEPCWQSGYPEQPFQYPKTLTTLLLDPEGKVLAWGWEAHKRYLQLSAKERLTHYYAKNFKLALSEEEGVALPMGYDAEYLIGEYLKCLKHHCTEALRTSYSASFHPSLVRYALTVPANWSEAAKHTMRAAAVKAGLVSYQNSDNLLLLHEPEAAAIAVRVLEKHVDVRPGAVFIIVDAGGGTVDISVHKVAKGSQGTVLEDATFRDGVTRGATFIDKAYEDWVTSKLGYTYEAWREDSKNAEAYMHFKDFEWEHLKRAFSSISVEKDCKVTIPRSLFKLLPEEVKAEVKAQSGEEDILLLKGYELASFFDHALEDITACIQGVLQRCPQKPDAMLLVGGLGSNKYVIERMQQEFGALKSIVVPPYGYSAVLQGAALYAAKPEVISARRSTLTYGIRCSEVATSSCPRGQHRFTHKDDGLEYCNAIFSQYIEQNQLIEPDFSVEHIFYPLYKQQSSVTFDIYGTEAATAKYTTEPGMQCISSVTINIADPSAVTDPNRYKLAAVMKFGTTEIQVRVVDMQTGEQATVDMAFASTSA